MYVSLLVFSSCHVTNGLFVLSLLPSSSLRPFCLSHNHDHMIYHCMDVFSWRIELKRKEKNLPLQSCCIILVKLIKK